MSNFPNGFTNGVTIRGVPITLLHPGKVFWVNNSSVLAPNGIGGSNTNPGTYTQPFSTIDYAIGRCVADRGDIIAIMPGHAENLSTAGAIAADVAGVAFVGLGSGAKAPTLSWTAAAATLAVSAANLTFYNMRFIANFADVITMWDLTGAADNITWEKCLFSDTSTILNAIDVITAATGADNLAWSNCRWDGRSASNDSFFTGVAHDGFFVENCHLMSNVAQTGVVGLMETSGNVTQAWIKDSHFFSNVDGALHLDFNGAANTGAVSNCYFGSVDVAGAVTAGFDLTGIHVFECYVAGEPDDYGLVGGGTVYNNA